MKYKTNVIRLLEREKLKYQVYDYTDCGMVRGMEVATYLHKNPEQLFKTLVTIGKSKQYYVFLIPIRKELDVKKAAALVGEKSISMVKSSDLFSITGYFHGGCSPIGMKKIYPTIIDCSVCSFTTILLSGGRIGIELEINLEDLQRLIPVSFADLCNSK